MKDETRYIVTSVTSVPVTRYMSKCVAYREITKPGWGLVEWYSASDGYKNPVSRDRSDKTQRMYCEENSYGVLYAENGNEFSIYPYEEINLKNAPRQAETVTMICSGSGGFSFWTKSRIKIFVTYSEMGLIETYRLEGESGIPEAGETEISFEDLQGEEDYESIDRADIPGTLEYFRKQEARK